MINFILSKPLILTQKSDCLLLFISQKKQKPQLLPAVKAIDAELNGLISDLCLRGDFQAKAEEVVPIFCQGFLHKRVLLIGMGEDDVDERLGVEAAAKFITKKAIKKVLLALDNYDAAIAAHSVIATMSAAYEFKLGGNQPKDNKRQQIAILSSAEFNQKNLNQAVAVGRGLCLTRHLAEQPSNLCTPEFLAITAMKMAKENADLKVKVLKEKQMQTLEMNALLAVAKGSENDPRLIVFEYNGGKKNEKPIALVGKGVTFDTGGISIKPAPAMDEMKFDMCGAATVFGVFQALCLAKLPINVVGIVPSVENMPDGKAVKPGDVVTSMSGQTIEILNTDAEGRLILADALFYAEKMHAPSKVIDIATLTGACVIALGAHSTGLMGRNHQFLADLQAAGDACGDACWPLPINKEYQKLLKSDYADMANIGGRAAGTITAACFLSRFVNCEQWAHLDIAGTAWDAKKRATGRPVPLLMHYLEGLSR